MGEIVWHLLIGGIFKLDEMVWFLLVRQMVADLRSQNGLSRKEGFEAVRALSLEKGDFGIPVMAIPGDRSHRIAFASKVAALNQRLQEAAEAPGAAPGTAVNAALNAALNAAGAEEQPEEEELTDDDPIDPEQAVLRAAIVLEKGLPIGIP